jgi:hypothetical protein
MFSSACVMVHPMKRNTMTLPLIIAATSLAFALSPTMGLANTPAKSKAHQTQVVRQPVRRTVNFQTPEAETESHGRSIEQVIKDQHAWYQMNS